MAVLTRDDLHELRHLRTGNTTVIATLLICALSISGAMFLILELDTPFAGLIRISSAPLRDALALLGQ